MDEVLSRGDAEEAPPLIQDNGVKWYIPHHGVYHCSVRFKGTSLNDHLLSRSDLTNNLKGALCRFRRYPCSVTCDVEKMFHQFVVSETDRDYLRFLLVA